MKTNLRPMLNVVAGALWTAAAVMWFTRGVPVAGLVCAGAAVGHIVTAAAIERHRAHGGRV